MNRNRYIPATPKVIELKSGHEAQLRGTVGVEHGVNSEQKSGDLFTVHTRAPSSGDATEEKP